MRAEVLGAIRTLRANPRLALSWLVAGLFGLIAAFIVIDTLLMVVRTYSPLPYWDQWDSLFDYQVLRHGNFTLDHLFGLHNEHRLAVPRLIFWADYALAGGTNKLNLTVIALIQLAHTALLLSLIGPRWRQPTTWVAAAAVVGLMMSMGQWENFTWGFQSQFVGVFALATSAYVLIGKAVGASGKQRLWLFAGAIGVLFLATFSMANGLVAAAIAVVLCLGLMAPWWMSLGTAAYVGLAALGYFHNYHAANDHSDLGYALSHLPDFLTYFLGYLGNLAGEQLLYQPLGQVPVVRPLATVLGAAGATLAAAAILLVIFRRETDRVQAVLVAVMLFVLATAAVTAMGRLNFGLWQAYSSRYRTPTCIFWSAQIVFWLRVTWPPIRIARRSIVVLAACGLVGLIWVQRAVKPEVFEKANSVHLAESAILAQVADIHALNGAFPRGGELLPRSQILREYRKSVFAEARSAWLGKPVTDIGPLRPDGCKGAFDVARRSPFGVLNGMRTIGWAWDMGAHRAAHDVVIANGQGRVVGIGRTGARRPDVQAALRYPWAIDSGWEAVARTHAAILTAYAILDNGGVCAVGVQNLTGLPPAISARAIPQSATGPRFGGKIGFTGGGAWTEGGVSNTVGAGLAGASVYGSWSGADSNIGVIQFGPLVIDQDAFVIGVVTGPDVSNQSILITDAKSSEILAALQPEKYSGWTWLRLSVPPTARGRPVLIEAVDQGAGWGQWLGVTEPRRLATG